MIELEESDMLAMVQGKNKVGKPNKSQATTSRANQKGKDKVPPLSDIKKPTSVSFVKRRDTRRMIVLNLRNGLRRKVIYPYLFVMSLIWLILIG